MPEPVEGTFSLLISVPEPVEGRSYSSLWFRLRSITVLFITTLGAWACRRHILTSHLAALACWRHVLNSHLGAWTCRRHHYFYFIKIRALLRTSLMFLWELKNAIISTKSPWTLCYRNSKTKQKNSTHGGFDKLSHRVIYYYSRCLSLSKAHYFYCIKIRVLSRTSLMFLWELKNAIISTKSPWTLCY